MSRKLSRARVSSLRRYAILPYRRRRESSWWAGRVTGNGGPFFSHHDL